MKADLYSKLVLTVIALSLSVIAIQLTIKDASAQVYARTGIQMVAICNLDGRNCVELTSDSKLKVTGNRFSAPASSALYLFSPALPAQEFEVPPGLDHKTDGDRVFSITATVYYKGTPQTF